MRHHDRPRKVLVADVENFECVVNKNDKDTFIKFYLPLCQQCRNFAPIFNKLAKTLAEEDVAFVKMDVSIDGAPPPYTPIHFPSLYWAPKNDKENPVKYEGDCELQDLINFVAKNATAELKGFDRDGKRKYQDDEDK